MTQTPNDIQPPYVYQAWPAWRYPPEGGEGQVFNAPDEVPEGWTNIPPGTSTAEDEPAPAAPPAEPVEQREDAAALAQRFKDELEAETKDEEAAEEVVEEQVELTDEEKAADRNAKIEKLRDTKEQKELVAELERMQAIQPNIEFATNWPKLKLATTIVDNGGPLED